MEFDLKTGMSAEVSKIVGENDTAASFGSGGVKVFATPLMIGLMENASLSAVDPFLPEGYATVGMTVSVSHSAATPVGMKVTAKAELVEIEGKKLTFKIEAYDEIEKIGEGTHVRFIIGLEKFIAKAMSKGK
ncbi:MAG: thioesterase family protein [Clostridiales bacterium]|nr:thioesterase family protein [Clostridiales bacterium]